MKRPDSGVVVDVAPGVRMLLCPNPGPMTHWGTNTYIVGTGEVVIIDPGPDNAEHLQSILAAVRNEVVSTILVTHAHRDHSKGAAQLAKRTGAEILAGLAHRTTTPFVDLSNATIGGGEGVDAAFRADAVAADGDFITISSLKLQVVALPGHFDSQIGFRFGDIVFCGDHVMDWAPSLVSPPDGHLGDFLSSCKKLIDMSPSLCLSGHGAPIIAPSDRLEWLVAHRKSREMQILDRLTNSPISIDKIVRSVYADVPQDLHAAAKRNVLAHLIDLIERDMVQPVGGDDKPTGFRLL